MNDDMVMICPYCGAVLFLPAAWIEQQVEGEQACGSCGFDFHWKLVQRPEIITEKYIKNIVVQAQIRPSNLS